MALIKCPECQKEVSDSAVSCPSCGFGIAAHVKKEQNPSNHKTVAKKKSHTKADSSSESKKISKRNIIAILFVAIIAIIIIVVTIYDYRAFVSLLILLLIVAVLIGLPIWLFLKLNNTPKKTATGNQYSNYSTQPNVAAAFCSRCGAPLNADAAFCSRCGAPSVSTPVLTQIPPQNQSYYPPVYQPQYYAPYQVDKESAGLNLLSFFFPFIGLILNLAFHDDKPIKAAACGKWGLIGFITGVCLVIVLGIISGIGGA